MTESKLIKIWELLSTYNFEINEDVSADVLCVICKKIMSDPYTASCGCHYCCNCIKDYIGEENKRCPGVNEDCHEQFLQMERNVLKNLGDCSKIAKTVVVCPNDTCVFKSKLGSIGDHIRICPARPIKCPYSVIGCLNDVIRGDNIDNHFDSNKITHSQLLMDSLNVLTNDMKGLTQDLELKQIEFNEIKEESGANKRRIDYLLEDNRQKEALIGEMKGELNGMKTTINLLFDKVGDGTLQNIADIDDHKNQIRRELDDLRTEILFVKEESQRTKTEVDDLKTDMIVVKDHARESANEMITVAGNDDLKNLMSKYDVKIEILKAEIRTIRQLSIAERYDFVWTISDFTKKNGQHCSDAFVKDGYRLCLRAYIDHNSKSGCFTLYAVIMRSDDDDKVEWPMRHWITVSILDQHNQREYKCWRLSYDTYTRSKTAFDRPIAEMNDNIVFGSNNNITDIQALLVDDSIGVCCSLTK